MINRRLRRAAAVGMTAALAAAAATTAPPARSAAPSAARPESGEVVAGFVHAADVTIAGGAARAAGLQVIDRWAEVDAVVAAGTRAQWHVAARQPEVEHIELDRPVELFLDTSHQATRGEEVLDDPLSYHDAGGAPLDGRGVTVAIVDTGIDGTHGMFQRADGTSKVVRNLRQPCHDFICEAWLDVPTNDSDTPSLGGHGTHVAGIAAGVAWENINEPIYGAAPGADLVGLAIGAYRSIIAGAAGLRWVLEHHADPCGDGSCPPIRVVNNSWGSTGDYRPEDVVSKLQDALVSAGVVVVWAAGNGGGDGSSNRVNPPAQSPTPGVIGVANYDDGNAGLRDNQLSPGSSRGELGRPETFPDVSAPGSSIRSSCRSPMAMCPTAVFGYATMGGTSMAAPHVAGIVAQLMQADPQLTPGEVEDILEDTAHRFTAGGSYEADPRNPDSPTSFDKGHGLVDVAAALQRVLAGS